MLFYPQVVGFKNRITARNRAAIIRLVIALVLAVLFWAGIFTVFYRVLAYFKSIELLGDILAAKLLSMVFLSFFSILIFSTIIAALATLFMSEDVPLILAAPVALSTIGITKCFETMLNSSWMVLLFSLPVFFSYGIVYQQGLWFYFVVMASLIPFILVCGAVGTGCAVVLTLVIPASRLRSIMLALSLVLGITLFALFRFLRPEQFVNPEAFRTVLDYVAALEMPAAPFLPSQWATDAVVALFLPGKDGVAFNLALLWSTALALLIIVNRFFRRVYFRAWTKSQESRPAPRGAPRFREMLLDRLLSWVAPTRRLIVVKDLSCFFRDSAQWPQLFILGAIIVIYLYNVSVLPLDQSPGATLYLHNVIAFLNLGLAGFTLAAVAARFAFPAVSIEGNSFWLIRSAPVRVQDFIWSKFWLYGAFLFVLAEALIICSNYLLQVDGFIMVLSCVTMAVMTGGIVSLSIGCGAVYPRFDVEHTAQIPTGFGGLLYMILAILFVGIVVILEAGPVYMVLMARFTGTALTDLQWLKIILAGAAVLIVNGLAFYLPLKIGIRALTAFEKF
mgnify:FL=1